MAISFREKVGGSDIVAISKSTGNRSDSQRPATSGHSGNNPVLGNKIFAAKKSPGSRMLKSDLHFKSRTPTVVVGARLLK